MEAMKPPKPFISAKPPTPPPMPESVLRGKAEAGLDANYAYHPPSTEGSTPARMARPKGGHGPHN
jgi:hypothetical protein